jgi:hypothetical protein
MITFRAYNRGGKVLILIGILVLVLSASPAVAKNKAKSANSSDIAAAYVPLSNHLVEEKKSFIRSPLLKSKKTKTEKLFLPKDLVTSQEVSKKTLFLNLKEASSSPVLDGNILGFQWDMDEGSQGVKAKGISQITKKWHVALTGEGQQIPQYDPANEPKTAGLLKIGLAYRY